MKAGSLEARFVETKPNALPDRVDKIARARAQSADLTFKYLEGEVSRLHGLVTGQLVEQLKILNKQVYDLKRLLYHPGLAVAPSAFNGQFSKHRIFSALCGQFLFDAFVETGTYEGNTTRFLAHAGMPVYSVESNSDFYQKASALLKDSPSVQLFLGDSPRILEHLLSEVIPRNNLVFFYLDAHWYVPLPLGEEMRKIAALHPRAVVMIDDIKVEGDEGYGYDSYGQTEEISLAYLDTVLTESNWRVFFPSMASAMDHNACDILMPRGTAVAACEEGIVATLKGMDDLRTGSSNH